MPITPSDLYALASRLNVVLAAYSSQLKLSLHFTFDRVNHPRNAPAITIPELEDIFLRFIQQHIAAVVRLHDQETFNIRCLRTHINMPCEIGRAAVEPLHLLFVITLMRKPTFFSKDRYDFHVY
jgi:hypothetical protein